MVLLKFIIRENNLFIYPKESYISYEELLITNIKKYKYFKKLKSIL